MAISPVCLLFLLGLVNGTPIFEETIESFEDPWDYQSIVRQADPLLEVKERLAKELRQSDEEVHVLDDDELLDPATVESTVGRLTCASCRLGVTLLRAEVLKNESLESIGVKVVDICLALDIAVEAVCQGIYDTFAPVVLPALKTCQLDSEKICSLLLGEKCGLVDNPTHEWSIDLPDDNNTNYDIWDSPPPQDGQPVFKVLQISDTHFDPSYQEGSIVNCPEPLCCRNSSTAPLANETIIRAGRFGSYGKCDAPKALIDELLNHVAQQHKDIDYIIWTGDIPPHDIWMQTKEQTLENVRETIRNMAEAFPGVPIFPTLGNHEGVPTGNFPPPWITSKEQSINWLYSEIAHEWSKWLPASTNTTLLHGGFYSILLRPKFRLVSLNTNYCHSFSWWLVLNSTDPAKELEWLVHELTVAEENDERVHIIGHIPPGQGDCYKVWSRNYYDIINRFRNTVVAQFFGHTHTDEFELFYDDEFTSRATSVAYVAPSVTTFEYLNPGYRLYYVDGDHATTTREVVDHETWIMDLAKANRNGGPSEESWKRLYSARKAYGMKSLRPADWSKLVTHLVIDDKLFRKFYRHFHKASPVRPLCNDPMCKFKIICDLKSAKSHDRQRLCHEEEEYFLGNNAE